MALLQNENVVIEKCLNEYESILETCTLSLCVSGVVLNKTDHR